MSRIPVGESRWYAFPPVRVLVAWIARKADVYVRSRDVSED